MSRELTDGEREIVALAREKYGTDPRDEVFFLDSGEALFQIRGRDGDGPWVHLTNLATWLAEGALTRDEIRDTQM